MTAFDLDLSKYELGWNDEVEYAFDPVKGLNQGVVEQISWWKGEPKWMTDLRLRSLSLFDRKPMAEWFAQNMPDIDFQDIYYYLRPAGEQVDEWDELPEEMMRTYEKLGIPEAERKYLAGVTAQYESEVVYHKNREDLEAQGILFCDMDTAMREYPDLVKKYFGSVIPPGDNKFASLNTAVWSGGSFIYVPPGVECEMPLQAYFRINSENAGQFERTLIIAEDESYVSYLEGCTAPQRDENQLHAAVVELVALKDAEIKYSTVQNWYPGDENGVGGIYNFVTKRGACRGDRSKISWTQVETGSAITWKYPSCVLKGKDSVGEFYSVAVTNGVQQADTGTKMIHLGEGSRSTIISKGISAGRSNNTYRGLVEMNKAAENSRNFTQCDSLLVGDTCGAHTVPYMVSRNPSAKIEHEATTSRISEDQLFYCLQRGLDEEEAVSLIVNGFCKEVMKELPMEFAVEAQKLIGISLEGSVG